MALQNLQQYGCQAANNLTKKPRDLNRNSSRNKNETMFGNGHENCPEFGVLGGVIFKLDILQAGQTITVLRERFRLHLPHIKLHTDNVIINLTVSSDKYSF